jgi:hypothetical protein
MEQSRNEVGGAAVGPFAQPAQLLGGVQKTDDASLFGERRSRNL